MALSASLLHSGSKKGTLASGVLSSGASSAATYSSVGPAVPTMEALVFLSAADVDASLLGDDDAADSS